MSEPNEGPRGGSLGRWRTQIALGSAALIAGVWLVDGPGIRSTDARPAPGSQAASDTARIAKLLCPRIDSARADSSIERFQAYRNECLRRAGTIADFSAPDLLDIHWTIPEFHDDQQLRDGPMPANPDKPGATKFGPRASAYAVPQIVGYRYMHQIEEQSPLGALVAYIVVKPPAAGGLPDSYKRLNLNVGVNCVWLAHDQGAPANTQWHGYVAAAGPQNKCEHSGALPTALEVHRVSPSPKLDDYPPAVRFGEGSFRGVAGADSVQPLLGVRCINGWCEIGPPKFVDGTPVPGEAFGAMSNKRRERQVKGWYDDQWLSDDATHQPLLRAAMIANPDLDSFRASDFQTPRHVATMYLFDIPPAGSSYTHWGLKRGKNELFLEVTATGTWKSSLGRPGAPGTIAWDIDRTTHHDEAVPGTARFHWRNSPNAGWTPCGEACCEVYGIS